MDNIGPVAPVVKLPIQRCRVSKYLQNVELKPIWRIHNRYSPFGIRISLKSVKHGSLYIIMVDYCNKKHLSDWFTVIS